MMGWGVAEEVHAGACAAGVSGALRGLALTGSGCTLSPRMMAAYCGSPGSTTLASLLASLYCGLDAGSTMMRAANTMPSSCFKPWMTRFCLAAGLSSCGSSPSALSTIARNALLEMFQPFDWPLSSSLPPAR